MPLFVAQQRGKEGKRGSLRWVRRFFRVPARGIGGKSPFVRCPPGRTRTFNLVVKSHLLYQLSYGRIYVAQMRPLAYTIPYGATTVRAEGGMSATHEKPSRQWPLVKTVYTTQRGFHLPLLRHGSGGERLYQPLPEMPLEPPCGCKSRRPRGGVRRHDAPRVIGSEARSLRYRAPLHYLRL